MAPRFRSRARIASWFPGLFNLDTDGPGIVECGIGGRLLLYCVHGVVA
jgi:hypothetical protein